MAVPVTFDPQALYNAVRPFTDQLMEEAELVRREHPNIVEADLISELHGSLYHATNLGFLLARVRREQERNA